MARPCFTSRIAARSHASNRATLHNTGAAADDRMTTSSVIPSGAAQPDAFHLDRRVAPLVAELAGQPEELPVVWAP